ncbi:MAG: hypothetical protein IKE51_06020 [Solobacterium sp.]|nr:hypothetical protein [Solobacterium sp.]
MPRLLMMLLIWIIRCLDFYGFYFVRSLNLLKYNFTHPELLEKPLSEPSGYHYDEL